MSEQQTTNDAKSSDELAAYKLDPHGFYNDVTGLAADYDPSSVVTLRIVPALHHERLPADNWRSDVSATFELGPDDLLDVAEWVHQLNVARARQKELDKWTPDELEAIEAQAGEVEHLYQEAADDAGRLAEHENHAEACLAAHKAYKETYDRICADAYREAYDKAMKPSTRPSFGRDGRQIRELRLSTIGSKGVTIKVAPSALAAGGVQIELGVHGEPRVLTLTGEEVKALQEGLDRESDPPVAADQIEATR